MNDNEFIFYKRNSRLLRSARYLSGSKNVFLKGRSRLLFLRILTAHEIHTPRHASSSRAK